MLPIDFVSCIWHFICFVKYILLCVHCTDQLLLIPVTHSVTGWELIMWSWQWYSRWANSMPSVELRGFITMFTGTCYWMHSDPDEFSAHFRIRYLPGVLTSPKRSHSLMIAAWHFVCFSHLSLSAVCLIRVIFPSVLMISRTPLHLTMFCDVFM